MQPIRKSSTPLPASLQKDRSSHKTAQSGRAGLYSDEKKQNQILHPPLLSKSSIDGSRQEKIDNLLLQLSKKVLPAGDLSSPKGIASLRGILVLLKKSPPEPGNSDSHLVNKFLDGWMEKYGKEIPPKLLKDLRYITHSFHREMQEVKILRENSGILYAMDSSAGQTDALPAWSLQIKEEKRKGVSDQEESSPYCVLQFNTPDLGPLKAVLQYDSHKSRVVFYSSGRKTRGKLRRSLEVFRDRLRQAGFQNCQLRVGRLFSSERILGELTESGNRIGLWG